MILVEFFGFGRDGGRSLRSNLKKALKANTGTSFLVGKIVTIHNDDAKVYDSEDKEFSFVRVSSTDEKHTEAISQTLESFSSKKTEKEKIYVAGQMLYIATNLNLSPTVQSALAEESTTSAI